MIRPRWLRRTTSVVVLGFVVMSISAVPAVAAPTASPPPDTQQSATPTHESTLTAGGNASDNVTRSVGGGFVPSPKRFAEAIINYIVSGLLDGIAFLAGYVTRLIAGMPAPGTSTDISSWSSPNDGLWPGVYDATKFSIALAAIGLVIASSWGFRHGDIYQQREAQRRVAVGFVMVLLTWVVAPLGLHLGAQLSIAVAPSGHEFTASLGNFAKFGFGPVLALILGGVDLVFILLGLLVLGAQYYLAHLIVFLWPLAWALRAFDGYMNSLGTFILYLYGGLITLNVGQAMMLRFIFELPWGRGGVPPFLGFISTVAGLAIALILFPAAMLHRITTASAVGLGVSAQSHSTHRRTQELRDSVGDLRESFRESGRGQRSTDGATNGASGTSGDGQSATAAQPTPTRGVGRVGGDLPTDETQNGIERREEREKQRIDHSIRGYQ